MLLRSTTGIALLAAVSMLLVSGSPAAQDEVIELEFGSPPAGASDTARTMESMVKVQGTGGLCQDALYLLTHYGDRERMFREENRELIVNPWKTQTWRFCSVFSAAGESSVTMGRNWDNQNVGSIIVSLYHPPGGFASISFSRAIDMGFPLNLDLIDIKSTPFGNSLLLAPFYAMDGINEHGLTVAIAGVGQATHETEGDREPVFITFLVRKLLDRARSVDEALDLVEEYVPFDLDQNSLNAHFFIVDSSGRSVILEYAEDRWQKIPGGRSWHVLTNKPVYDVPDAALRDKCWRYRSMSEALENAVDDLDWRAGMGILQGVTQKGTIWSAVYSPPTKEIHFSVYQEWDTVYHMSIQ